MDELPHQIGPRALRQSSKRNHLRNAKTFQSTERRGFAHERFHFFLARILREHFEGHFVPGDAIPDGPNLASATLAQA